jgi:hypothetical protein
MSMTEPAENFAIIPVSGHKPPDNAIMHGPLDVITERVLGSRARADALDLVARAADAAEQEREREQQEQAVLAEGVKAIADGIAQLSRRLDAIEQSQIARHKLDAASEATQQLLALPKDVPADTMATPSPSGELHDLPPEHPAKHQPAPADQGDLPRALERGAPPETGNYPTLEDPSREQVSQPIALEE